MKGAPGKLMKVPRMGGRKTTMPVTDRPMPVYQDGPKNF
jgi:hypothetical protein